MSSSYSYNTAIWPALITLALAIYLGAYGWRRRHLPAAKPFAVACLMGGMWAIGVILELSAVNFADKVFWVKFQAIWQLPTGTAIACFILQYGRLGRWLNRHTYTLLFLLPVLSMLVIVTNDVHHLMWTGFQMKKYVVASPGRLYWVFTSYVYLLGVMNFVVLVRLAVISPGHRLPVAIILGGQIVARAGYTLDKLELGLVGRGELLLLSVGLMAVIYAFAVLRFHAIDPVAAACTAALRQMREGLIVLDPQGRIADVNPMAAAMLQDSETSLRQKPLEDVLPVDPGELRRMIDEGIGRTDITLGKDPSARQCTLNLTSLRGRHGERIGQLILLHDVTEQRRAQERILEHKSVVATLQERERLARELHDGIGQVLGYMGMQTQTALKWLDDGNHEKTQLLLRRLVAVAKDAHADVRESILALKTGSGQQWSFLAALREYVDKFQSNYGIRAALAVSEGIDEATFDRATGVHLLRAIQEALTNARKHSGAKELAVRLDQDGTRAHITITDDGQGFDAGRVGDGSGAHFGLVFMRERMEQVGGRLKITSAAGGGTALQLDVPIATHREETR